MDEMIIKNAIGFIDAYSVNDVEKMEELQWGLKKGVSYTILLKRSIHIYLDLRFTILRAMTYGNKNHS